jgi:4-hydroxy-tetrahydrodipicolinate synthase
MATESPRPAPFGHVLTAMVTPFTDDGALDLDGAQRLATHLVDSGNDGLVVSGTTGEAPTTSDAEKSDLLRAVLEAVGDRAHVVAGIGTNDTEHSIQLAKTAARLGAHGLLAVTPYYSRPPREGVYQHFAAIADATDRPVMIYDIPVRTGTPVDTETLLRLAEHDRIVAVKDAKDDLGASSIVLATTDLAYYCGTDMLNLPALSIGACGVVSVVTHVLAGQVRALVDSFLAGDAAKALEIHRGLLPAYTGMFRTQGVIMAKAALRLLGLPSGPVRLPLVCATPEQTDLLRADLVTCGLRLAE